MSDPQTSVEALLKRLEDSAWYKRANGDDKLMKEAAATIAELQAKLEQEDVELWEAIDTAFNAGWLSALERREYEERGSPYAPDAPEAFRQHLEDRRALAPVADQTPPSDHEAWKRVTDYGRRSMRGAIEARRRATTEDQTEGESNG